MEQNQQVATPAYRKIAIDIAKNIAIGVYAEKQKLYGRSVLASQYGVSPETIRKAIFLLKDVGILETEKGSGIEIISAYKAKDFIDRHNEVQKIALLETEISEWAVRQAKEAADVVGKIQFIINMAERIKNTSPLVPYEIKITQNSTAIGKSADELKFWHNTGATIIAIRREENLIISPGPYATFCENDVFYTIGNDESYAATIKLLFE